MGLLRSEEMTQGVLVMPVQDAKKYVELVGQNVNMQFEDMNARDMRRPYRKYVQRVEELERILRFVTAEMCNLDGFEVKRNCVKSFLDSGEYQLESVEDELITLNKHLVRMKEMNSTLINEKNQTQEEIEVMGRATELLKGCDSDVTADTLTSSLVAGDMLDRRVNQIAGVVSQADENKLRIAVFRASRGNAFIDVHPLEKAVVDPKTGTPVQKSVFVIYFQAAGGASAPMHQKVSKVCQALGVNTYPWPSDVHSAKSRHSALEAAFMEKDQALSSYTSFVDQEMRRLIHCPREDGNSLIEEYRLFCIKEKAVYSILNLCDGDMVLRVNVWYPTADQKKIENLLSESAACFSGERAMIMPKKTRPSQAPPTYIKTNEYTAPWQDVINTYGVPRYQEANPALISVVTFPFIFGMMYGDVGHGSMLFLVGVFLVLYGEKFRYTVPALCEARYLVLSLGFFATFAGFMYNDMFSIGLPMFASRWDCQIGTGLESPPAANFDGANSGGPGPYPFGLDWCWIGASNELLFVNSLKMKLSVLFGVLQMIVGVIFRWMNAVHDRNFIDFFFECVPMMIFMICFFGWMDFMILYKWVNPVSNPPSIINSLICMAMQQEDTHPIYEGSVALSKQLFLATFLSVPIMLFPKPFILLAKHKMSKQKDSSTILEDKESNVSGGHSEEEFEFGEIFIHQIIETIEYVLGTVSHTASYLRIWALSLAHQQLSQVFFDKTFTMGLVMPFPANGFALYFLFAAWFGVTLGVLLGMDVLECFLHTLRLHWVEFQSKFYRADGYLFEPFDIKKLVSVTED
jgi:V-type H+-transporting ATPase subunit a